MNTGYRQSSYDQRDYAYSNYIEYGDLQRHAEINAARFFNQDGRGTCVGAGGTLIKEIIEREDIGNVKLSVEHAYRNCKRLDDFDGEGTHPRIMAKVMKDLGICEEWLLEYGDDRVFTEEMIHNALKYRVKSYLKINTLEEYMDTTLKGNPVLIGASISKNFRNICTLDENTGRYIGWHPFEPLVGGHAFLGLGYDLDMEYKYSDGVIVKGFLKCQTTWMLRDNIFGDDSGVFWIPIDFITRPTPMITEMYTFVDIKTGGPKMFKDVEQDRWSKKAIDYVSANDLMAGFPDGSFKPGEPLTREQMAQVLYQLSKKE